MDCSLPGSCVHGILQARILEWVAISFPRDLPDPGIETGSPALEADTLTSEPTLILNVMAFGDEALGGDGFDEVMRVKS